MKDYDNYPYGAYLARDSYIYFNRRYEPIVRVAQPAFPATPYGQALLLFRRERTAPRFANPRQAEEPTRYDSRACG